MAEMRSTVVTALWWTGPMSAASPESFPAEKTPSVSRGLGSVTEKR